MTSVQATLGTLYPSYVAMISSVYYGTHGVA